MKITTASSKIRAGLPLALGLSAALFASASLAQDKAETTDPIRLVSMGAPDGDFMTLALAEALKRVGYTVEIQTVDFAAHFIAVANGDLDMSVIAWPNYPELKAGAIEAGNVADYGGTGVTIREGWWYPDYVAALCPGLPDWTALKDSACVTALSTAETAPKGRVVDAPADWGSNSDKRVAALGLDLQLVNPGSATGLGAALQGAIDRKEPIIGWGIKPYWVTDQNPGAWVELPAFDPACITDPAWGPNPNATYDCDWLAGEVTKFGNSARLEKIPLAARILTNFKLDVADVAAATKAVDVDGQTLEDYMTGWVAAHGDLLDSWAK
jgi:glycine betaine/proline transport system substrate-binding protein